MFTRRDFIKTMSLMSGAVLTPVSWLGKWAGVQPAEVEEPDIGELYAGFVLLPEGAPMPSFVSCASVPILCHLDESDDAETMESRGETLRFDDLSELLNQISFHTYTPRALPADMEFVQGHLLRFAQSGKVFSVGIDFGSTFDREPVLSTSAQPIFPRPHPVWPVEVPIRTKGSTDGPPEAWVAAYPEKVDFTPTPGLVLPTEQGHILLWIDHDILYTLIVNHDPRREAAMEMARSLVETSPSR